MAEQYVLDLTLDECCFNDVHKAICSHVLHAQHEEIGSFFAPSSAVIAAKLKHPYRKIKGCNYCFAIFAQE